MQVVFQHVQTTVASDGLQFSDVASPLQEISTKTMTQSVRCNTLYTASFSVPVEHLVKCARICSSAILIGEHTVGQWCVTSLFYPSLKQSGHVHADCHQTGACLAHLRNDYTALI